MHKDYKNIIKNFLGGNLSTILFILTGIITARILGPKGKGELISAIYWPQMFAWIFNLSIGYSNTYFVARDKEKLKDVISNSIFLGIILGIIAIIIGYFAIPSLIKDKSLHTMVRFGLLAIPFFIVGDYLTWVFNGLERYTFFNLMRLVYPCVYLILLLIFIKTLTVKIAFFSAIGCSFISTIIPMFILLRNTHFSFKINVHLLIESLKLGIKSHIGHFAVLGNKRADQAILIAMVSPSLIAFYAMAVNITELLLQVSNAIALTIIPSTASLNIKETKVLILKRIKLATLSLLVGGIILYFIAKYLILLLYGKAFLPALLPAKILIPGTIFLGLSAILEGGLKGKMRPLLASTSQITALALNIILLAVLIPFMNIVGAALASDIAYFTLFIFDAIFLTQILKI